MEITYTVTTKEKEKVMLLVDDVETEVSNMEHIYTPDQEGLSVKSWFMGNHLDGTTQFQRQELYWLDRFLNEWLVEAEYDPTYYVIHNMGPGKATIIHKGKDTHGSEALQPSEDQDPVSLDEI
tara:strand:- start:5702 stop:6070 length:369 start_codon:yes stop_codon:yes gene_type:complete